MQLGGLGKRCIPLAGCGAESRPKTISVLLALKSDIWWQQFWRFSWESTDEKAWSDFFKDTQFDI